MTVPGKGGRPEKRIDWEQVATLAKIDCTLAEIAAVTGVSDDCLLMRCKKEHGKTIGTFIRENREAGKASLRRALVSKAIKDKDGPTLRFLAENRLGYGSKSEHVVSVQRPDLESEAVKRLSKEELLALAEIKDKISEPTDEPD